MQKEGLQLNAEEIIVTIISLKNAYSAVWRGGCTASDAYLPDGLLTTITVAMGRLALP